MATAWEINDYKLKVIFLIHFFLASLSCLGHWESDSLFFYNLILIFCLAWAIHREQNEEPVQMALIVNVCSIFFDIALLGANFPRTYWPNNFFSGMVCLVTLICRPCTSYLMAKEIQERRGIIGPLNVNEVLFANGKVVNKSHEPTTPSTQIGVTVIT